MNTKEIAKSLSFTAVNESEIREVRGVYCCDLLSVVMGRAGADTAWVTVMGNINAIAVALLCDVSCIVVAEGMPVDADAASRAKEQGVIVYQTEMPVFDAALAIHRLIS